MPHLDVKIARMHVDTWKFCYKLTAKLPFVDALEGLGSSSSFRTCGPCGRYLGTLPNKDQAWQMALYKHGLSIWLSYTWQSMVNMMISHEIGIFAVALSL